MGNNASYLNEEKKEKKWKKKERKFLIKQTNELFKYALKQDSEKNYLEAFTSYRQGVENIYYLINVSKDEEFKVELWKSSVDYVQRALHLDLYLKKHNITGHIPAGIKYNKELIKDDFQYEGFVTKEDKEILEGLKSCVSTCSHLSWDDVVGLEDVKKTLRKQFIWPMQYPDLIRPEKSCQGMLLYGQPGTGKTFVAQCAASEIPDVTFFNFGTSVLKSKWHGSSERATAMMFEMARQRQPSIIFIDEADVLFGKRSEGKENNSDMAGALLKGMSSYQGGIFLIAATNYPGRIDSAFYRRFSIKVHVTMPTKLERMKIIEKIHEKRDPDSTSDLLQADFKWLAEMTEKYCSGDLAEIMKRLQTEQFNTVDRAKYFRRTESSKDVWVPCTKYEEGAEEHYWEKLKGKGATILRPPLTRYHLKRALKHVRATVPDDGIIDGINAYAKQYGYLD